MAGTVSPSQVSPANDTSTVHTSTERERTFNRDVQLEVPIKSFPMLTDSELLRSRLITNPMHARYIFPRVSTRKYLDSSKMRPDDHPFSFIQRMELAILALPSQMLPPDVRGFIVQKLAIRNELALKLANATGPAFPFQLLPGEIRNQIYNILVDDACDHRDHDCGYTCCSMYAAPNKARILFGEYGIRTIGLRPIPLMFANKQIYREFSSEIARRIGQIPVIIDGLYLSLSTLPRPPLDLYVSLKSLRRQPINLQRLEHGSFVQRQSQAFTITISRPVWEDLEHASWEDYKPPPVLQYLKDCQALKELHIFIDFDSIYEDHGSELFHGRVGPGTEAGKVLSNAIKTITSFYNAIKPEKGSIQFCHRPHSSFGFAICQVHWLDAFEQHAAETGCTNLPLSWIDRIDMQHLYQLKRFTRTEKRGYIQPLECESINWSQTNYLQRAKSTSRDISFAVEHAWKQGKRTRRKTAEEKPARASVEQSTAARADIEIVGQDGSATEYTLGQAEEGKARIAFATQEGQFEAAKARVAFAAQEEKARKATAARKEAEAAKRAAIIEAQEAAAKEQAARDAEKWAKKRDSNRARRVTRKRVKREAPNDAEEMAQELGEADLYEVDTSFGRIIQEEDNIVENPEDTEMSEWTTVVGKRGKRGHAGGQDCA